MVAKTQQAQAVVAAIFLLAFGQLFVIGLGWARGLTLQDAIRSIARERRAADEKYNKSFVTAKLFENEIADLKRRMGLSEKEIQDEMAAMRAQFQELAQRYAADSANARLQQQMQQQPNPPNSRSRCKARRRASISIFCLNPSLI